MSVITLRVIDGADRGHVYNNLLTPVTIGREEGNSVQLNDERISRFHIKIQEDQSKLVLTDLESTNGTRINGEDAQLRILRFGDVISVGRSVLVYGSREQIIARLNTLHNSNKNNRKSSEDTAAENIDALESGLLNPQNDDSSTQDIASYLEAASPKNFDLRWNDSEDLQEILHIPQPPDLPTKLTPGQAAQLSELIEYIHLRGRSLLQSAKETNAGKQMTLNFEDWQKWIDFQSQLAEYLRRVGEPDSN